MQLLELCPCDTATELQSWHQLPSLPSCLWDELLASSTTFKSKITLVSFGKCPVPPKREEKGPSTSLKELELCVGTQGALTTGENISLVLANAHLGHYFFVPMIAHTEIFHRVFNNFYRSYRVGFYLKSMLQINGLLFSTHSSGKII